MYMDKLGTLYVLLRELIAVVAREVILVLVLDIKNKRKTKAK